MKRTILMILSVLLLIPMILLSGCGSGDDGAGGNIYTIINSNPENLDPQLAKDSCSMSVIRNIFEGLTEVDENGEIKCAAAESYTVSEDMRTYTFRLREGAVWKSAGGFSAEVTAADFVYGFRRIFDPKMQSPYTEKFAAIKNSAFVYSGVMSAADLGVKAPDPYTVVFTLDYPVSDFLYLLSTAAAMPCSEEFFKSTGGRYGLSAKYTAGNGAFTLVDWNYDPYWNENFLTLKRTPENSTPSRRTYPAYVNYIIADSVSEYEEASGNTIDCQVCKVGKLPRMKGKKAGEYPCAAVGVTFNPHDEIFSNYNIRKALSLTADISVYDRNTSLGISVGYGAIPPAVTVMGKSVRELFGDISVKGGGGAELWSKGLAETGGNYPELETIIIPESFADASIVYMLTDNWNSELGFSCGTEILSDREYRRRISEGEYSMALTVITSQSAAVPDFLDSYRSYIIGGELEDFSAAVGGARYSVSVTDALHNYRTAERLLIDGAHYIPVFYQSDFLVTGKNISGVIYDPFSGAINFKTAKKFGG